MKKLPSLSIFYPACNDGSSLPQLVKTAYRVGRKITADLEVLIINDGSKDNTPAVLTQLKREYPDLKIITHAKNQGYGAALRDGFLNATKEYIFYTDGDGQYNPEELVKLVDKLTNDTDIVNGYKKIRRDPLIRVVMGDIYNFVLRRIYRLPISDVDCDFRLIKKSALDKITLVSSSGMICLELIKKLKRAGAHFAEVPVNHYPRKYGRSQFFTPANLIKTLTDDLFFFFKYKRGKI